MDEYLAAIEDGLNRSLFFQIDSNVDKMRHGRAVVGEAG